MGQIKWYKRDPQAALDGMLALSLEERGAYNTVLDLIYVRDGKLPDDDRFIAGWMGVDVRVWKRIKDRLIQFGKLYSEGGLLRNSRADDEVDNALRRVASSRYAGEQSGKVRRKKLVADTHKNNNLDETDVPTKNERNPEPYRDRDIEEEEPNGSHTPHSPPPKNSKPAKVAKIAMPPDWEPTDLSGDVGEMLAQWPPGRLKSEIAEFREYWIDDGAKRPGWDRTFRSRIRNIHDRVMRENRNGSSGKSQRRDNRDGFTRAIHDELGFEHPDQPSAQAGRHDPGGGGTVGALPAPGPAALR